MKFFNAFFGTLTAGLLAATLTLTAASWIGISADAQTQLASAELTTPVQNG